MSAHAAAMERVASRMGPRGGAHAAPAPASAARVLAEDGQPLPAPLQRDMAQRFGHDFSQVRVHAGPAAAQSALDAGAHAYASGRHIVFGAGRYVPDSGAGRRLIAHELTHVMEQGGVADRAVVHCQKPDVAAAAPGSIDGAIDMAVAAKVRFDASPSDQPGAIALLDKLSRYLSEALTDAKIDAKRRYLGSKALDVHNVRAAPASLAGKIRSGYPVDARHWNEVIGGLRMAKIALQIVVGERFPEQTGMYYEGMYASDEEEAQHELAADFKEHVMAASQDTGPQGITPLVLASVLHNEIANTAVIGQPLETPAEARADEVKKVDASLKRAAAGAQVDPADIDRSVGVGQIKLSTAAAMAGKIPWRESNPATRHGVRAQTAQDFAALGVDVKSAVLRILADPRKNIFVAAALLKRLKNRPHRYPAMPRAQFGADEQAVKLIATEYNIGASDTPLAAAKPTDYGDTVWKLMGSAVLKRNFPNT
ncbi:uncharacterized protein DUF4157 [Pseudoduganella flava]|uniref:DUF4157 domain-containing protein n=1 Tax=Pseudoduganella flava TaxID=871742 RepID=A0A562Q0P0_9BURK|nr:DUF4157 domain-containing protein [Pseudoduganella flava]QGZ38230.1 DUF4157 domain-containing protein [Pseudoduganella flava]TWI50239.1 uncharacterized protein DUF4157 [Pseudoduganella flava]